MKATDSIVIKQKNETISNIGGLLQRKIRKRTKINVECNHLEESIKLMKEDLYEYELAVGAAPASKDD